MKKANKIIFITCVMSIILSCNNAEIKNKKDFKNTSNISTINREHFFKNDKILYKWKFKRDYNKKLDALITKELAVKSFYYGFFNDTLALTDWNNKTINLYDKQLNLLNKLGKAGDGTPDENGNIMYFGLQNKRIFIYDFNKLIMKKLDFNNKLIKYQKMPYSYKGKFINNETFYITHYDKNNILKFSKFNFADNSYIYTKTFEKILSKYSSKIKQSNDFVFEGRFDNGINQDYSVYFFYKAGYFIVINNHNGNFSTFQTVDKTPFPKGIKKDLGGGFTTYSTKPDVIFFLSATTDTKYLYLLNNITDHENSKNKVVDYYKLTDGKYIGSILVPDLEDEQTAKQIAIDKSGKYLYVYYDILTMIKYEIK